MPRSRHYRIARHLLRSLVFVVAFILVVFGIAVAALETSWGKNRLRDLIVSQANQYLTAQLAIGRLEGSLFRGLELADIQLARDSRTIIRIERVSLSYSIRELLDQGTAIRRIRIDKPHVVARRQSDGRWDIATVVRREARQRERTGPGRPVHIRSIEVVDGQVELHDPLRVGAAHIPTRFDRLNTTLSFEYKPVTWRLDFTDMSWVGSAPDLTIERLAGTITNGDAGLTFGDLLIRTPRSEFTLDGRIVRERRPTVLDLQIHASRFAFQEWSGILTGLRNIAVEASFEAKLAGPLAKLATDLDLRSTGGNARGPFVLDTTVPGWRGVGSVALERLNLARWLNRPDRPSDITGQVDFDLDLRLGRVPIGSYAFDGVHAEYLGYAGDNVRAKGTIEPDRVLIAAASARAYGGNVRLSSGVIAFASPFPYQFRGSASEIDLRQLPDAIPVPHVESMLAFDYDVTGQFSAPFITGHAVFAPSEFLGAQIGAGASGTVDTAVRPVRYTGEGDIGGLDLQRFGAGLNVGWMQDPRYAGTLAGHFQVAGTIADRQTMVLDGGGRLSRGDFFDGTLSDADVTVHIEGGSLRASYDGDLSGVNPAIPLDDERYRAALTGSGRATFNVNELMTRSPQLDDYEIEATIDVADPTRVRGVAIETGRVEAKLAHGALSLTRMELSGPALVAEASGVLELDGTSASQLDYRVSRAELAQLHELTGRHIPGQLTTNGRLTGPADALRFAGDATMNRLAVSGVSALTTEARYDIALRDGSPASVTITGTASFVEALEQTFQQIEGTVTYADDRFNADLMIKQSDAIQGGLTGTFAVDTVRRTVDVADLEVAVRDSAWLLAPAAAAPRVAWDDSGISITSMTFVSKTAPDQRVSVSGTWREDGEGALTITATHVALDTFTDEQPPRYGGTLDAVATLRGTRQRPLMRADLTVSNGAVRDLKYEKLIGRVDYFDQALRVDLRLDQAPGVWLTAAGSVPLSVFDRSRPEQPMDLEIASSTIGLGLIEGLTSAVREVSGTMQLDLTVVGTTRDPHVAGIVEIASAAFTVAATGARYQNGRTSLRLSTDLIRVEAFHLEDSRRRPLEVRGSLGTHELRVGDLEIDATAKGFEVLRNEFGTIEVDANLNFRGRAELPSVGGTITVVGGELKVDEVLDRTLFRPYAVQSAPALSPDTVDAVAALNPWDRLALNVTLRIPGTLRMTGDEVQVTAGTPIGLGDINLRVFGELNLYKDPMDVLYVNGSLDSLTGTYSFQSRRFDVDPSSSVNFHGDLNPELYVTVGRVISGVDTRVSIIGPLREPELRLTSTPPLEPSDVLALIVFGTPANLLSDLQQRELAVRAGVLAAGFLAAPLVGALERTLGLEILEIEAPDDPSRSGPRVTIGDELLPGLIARVSRQFGRDEYDEATIEYYLSRIFQIRATFSDAMSLTRTPFRRAERAGIDFILFFSF
jgi:autotransporter translocation and assembly factor TamB